MEENRKAFKVDLEKIPEYLEEQNKKYGSDAHVNGICPRTGRPYESKSSWDSMPALLRPVGGVRYCSECHILLSC